MKGFISCIIFILLLVANADASHYTVKKGDNLYDIAKRFGTSSQALKDANNLSSHKLSIGMKLEIPGDAGVPAKKSRKDSSTCRNDEGKSRTQAANDSHHGHYVVKKGDTVDKIAKKQGISRKELLALNNLPKTTKNLKTGQKLLVKKTEPAAVSERTATYKVKKGDTIQKVARKFDLTAKDIQELNNLSSSRLKPGQTIIVSKGIQESPQKDSPSEEGVVSSAQKPSSTSSARLSEVRVMAESDDISQLSMTDRLTLFAKKMLHLPYKFGGNGSIGLDCSSFVQKVYNFAGIDLPRSAREQYKIGEAVDKEELSIGDLVFFRTYASFPSHVGIYLGNNLFIHASSKSKKVTIDSLETPYYVKRYIGAKRLVPEGNIN